VKNALFTFIFAFCARGRVEKAICVYSASHVTRFQPMRLQHFWWWDNNTFSRISLFQRNRGKPKNTRRRGVEQEMKEAGVT